MKYSDFVKKVAVEAGVTQSTVKVTLDAAMLIIKGAVKSKDEVVLKGVGKICRKIRPARTGINPATKEKIEIPETVVAVFKASKDFREHLNS